MQRSTRGAAWLLLILVAALALRWGAAWAWEQQLPEEQKFGFGDSESYWQLARSIAFGKPYTYPTEDFHVFRAPGYPLLLAPTMIGREKEPPTIFVRAYSAVLSTLGVGGVFWLGKELFGIRAGLIAAIGVALDPGLIALGALLLSDGPSAAVLPFQMVLWIKAWRSEQTRQKILLYLCAGMMAGIASLIRPSWLLFTPFAITIGLLFSPRRKEHLQAAPWLMLGLALIMAPWWIRNYVQTGRLVLTTLQVGASLYDGLNPRATGGSNMDFTLPEEAKLRAADEANPPPSNDTFEYRLNQMFLHKSIDWAKQDPVAVLRLAGNKLHRLWNIWPNEAQFRHPVIRVAVFFSFVPVFGLACIGLWKFRTLGWPVVLLALPCVYFSLLHMIFVSSLRYRLPAMLLLYVLAAGVIDAYWRSKEVSR